MKLIHIAELAPMSADEVTSLREAPRAVVLPSRTGVPPCYAARTVSIAQEQRVGGRELILSGEHDLALTVLQTALGKDLANARAVSLLAYLFESHGDYNAALELHEDHKRVKKGRGR